MAGFRSSSGKSLRTVLAGVVVVLASLSAIPARAGGLPVLVRTSVDSGWSNHPTDVAARFDRALNFTSSASLVDKNGNLVPGSSRRLDDDYRVILFRADPVECSCPLGAKGAPYTITFTANSLGEDSMTTTVQRTFRIDLVRPVVPTLDNGRLIVATAGTVKISGRASDPIGPPPAFSSDSTSGVQRVEVRVYNPLESLHSPLLDFDFSDPDSAALTLALSLDDEIVSRRVTLASTCVIGLCPQSVSFSADVTLPAGVWAIRVLAYDLAGNESGPTHPVIVVSTAAA